MFCIIVPNCINERFNAMQLRGEATAASARSGELDPETLAALSPEQRKQLEQLRLETQRLRGVGDASDSSP